MLVEFFFLLLELGRRRRGGLVGLLLAFSIGVGRGEALRQALEAPAERRDVGLLLTQTGRSCSAATGATATSIFTSILVFSSPILIMRKPMRF